MISTRRACGVPSRQQCRQARRGERQSIATKTPRRKATIRQCETRAQHFTRDLSVGDEGADVEILQSEVLGMNQVDGKFGQDTFERLAEWQSNSGLEATGYFGSASRTKIGEMVESSITKQSSAESLRTVNRGLQMSMSLATNHINMPPPGVSSLWVGLAVGFAGLRNEMESRLRKGSRQGSRKFSFSSRKILRRESGNTKKMKNTTSPEASATTTPAVAEKIARLDDECTSVAEWASRQRERNRLRALDSTDSSKDKTEVEGAERLQRRVPYALKPSPDAQAKIVRRARQKQKQQKQLGKNQDKTLLKKIINPDGTKTFVLQSKPPQRPLVVKTKPVEREIDRSQENIGKRTLLTCSEPEEKHEIVKYTGGGRPSSVDRTISQSVKSAVIESGSVAKWLEPFNKTQKSALDVETEKALASHLSKQISSSYVLEDKALDSISTAQARVAGPARPKDRNVKQEGKEAAVPALAAAVGAAAVGASLGAEDALVGAISPVSDVSAFLYPFLIQPAFELIGVAATSTLFFKYFLQKEDRDNTIRTLVHLGKRVGVVPEESAQKPGIEELLPKKKMLPGKSLSKAQDRPDLPARSSEMLPKLPKRLLEWNSQQEDLQAQERSVIAKLIHKRSPVEYTKSEDISQADGPTLLSKEDSSSLPKQDSIEFKKTMLSLPSLDTKIVGGAEDGVDQSFDVGGTRSQLQDTPSSPTLPKLEGSGDFKKDSSWQTPDAVGEVQEVERNYGATESRSPRMTNDDMEGTSNSPYGVLDRPSRAVNPALDRDRARSHQATGTAVEQEKPGRPLWEVLTEIFKQKRRPEPETTIVRFSVEYVTKVGQNLKLIGDHEALGNWDKSKAISMSWSSGHLWTAEVELPCRKTYFYKYVIEEGGYLTWQQGNNRLLTIPDSGTAGAGPLIEAHDNWNGDPLNSSVMQTTVDGAVSWPESAEERLHMLLDENSDLDIDTSALMESLLAKNMTIEEFRDELLEILERLKDDKKSSS